MNAPRPLAAIAALATLTASLPAQTDDARRSAAEAARNRFLQGWMAELLDGDRALAHRFYAAAAEAGESADLSEPLASGNETTTVAPESAAELALLRRWESTLSLRERRETREALERRNVYVDTDRDYARMPWRSLDRLQREFADALVARDPLRVQQLREELAALVATNPALHDPRPLLPGVLAARRGERRAPAVDQQIMSWRREREAALARGDQRQARNLRWQIWHKQRTGARQASRQLLAKRWTEMTRLHLAGEHQRASGMERLIRGTESRFGNRGRSIAAEELIGSIQTTHRDNHRARLERVRHNLDELLARRDLMSAEVATLRELAARLAAAGDGGDATAGLILAARTPYRRELFGSD